MSAHHRHSPSGAEKWFTCPGSLNKEDGLYDVPSEYSSEGTAAHTVRERCLNTGIDVQALVGEWIPADDLFFEVTPDWAAYLQPGIDRIREAKGFTWVFEYRTQMDPWIPGGFGTLDAGGISKNLIIIDDLKFGAGVPVDAERNKQLMIYALGFWMNYARRHTKATRFLLRIDQPRVLDKGGEWYVELDELLEFAKDLEVAVARTLDPNAPLVPSPDGCRFCRASRSLKCETLDEFVLDLLGLTYSDLDNIRGKLELIATTGMNPERMAKVMENASLIKSWLSTIHGIALQEALTAEAPPGFKAVATLGDRSWLSEQAAEEFWAGKIPEKNAYNKRLKSPAQMELVAGTRNWAKAQSLIVRPEGPPALVALSDKRPALASLSDLLDDLDDMDLDEDLVGSSDITSESPIYDDLV